MRAVLQKTFVTAQIVPVKDHREGLAAVESGSADAYASDRVILIGLVITAKEGQFAIGEQYLSYEPYGFMLRRGDSPFRLAVNRVLSSPTGRARSCRSTAGGSASSASPATS